MHWVLERLDTWQARLVSGLAMAGALIAVFIPDEHWRPDWAAVCGLAAATLAWLVTTLQVSTEPHPHDVRLFTEFQRLVSDAEREFLDTQDFAALFRRDRYNGVRTIRLDWNGPRYAFFDRRLERAWRQVKEQIDMFGDLVGLYTQPAANHEFQTVQHARDHGNDLSPETRAEARAMNEAAAELVNRIDRFEVLAKRRLRS